MKRGLLILGLAAGAALCVSVIWAVRQPAKEVVEARELADRREFLKSLSILNRYVKDHPADREASLLAARTARRAGRFSDATRFLKIYADAGGSKDEIGREEILSGAQVGSAEAADRLLAECNLDHPSERDFYALEAIAMGCWASLEEQEKKTGSVDIGLQTDRAVRAADALLRAPMKPADRVEALVLSGNIHRKSQIHDRAVRDLRQAVELDPKHSGARSSLVLAIAQEAPLEAMDHLEILAERDPDDAATRYSLASLKRAVGRHEDARKILDELLRHKPDDAQFLTERGNVDLDAGRTDRAEIFFRRALASDAKSAAAHLGLSKSLRSQGNLADADKHFVRFQELDKPSASPPPPKIGPPR